MENENKTVRDEFAEQVGNAEYFYTSDFKLACFLRSNGAKFRGVKNFGTLEYPHFRFEFEQGIIGIEDAKECKDKFVELRELWDLDNEKGREKTLYCVAVLNANKEIKMCLKTNFEKRKRELIDKVGDEEAQKYLKVITRSKK